MAKRRGFDVIEDAHELAQHNYHHPYWVNRVTSYTYATWMAEKKLSMIIIPFLIITWILVIKTLASGERGFWNELFDFSDAASTYRFALFLFLIFYTAVTLIASFQVLVDRIQKPIEQPEQNEKKKEKKKKNPKRRKDYGRN